MKTNIILILALALSALASCKKTEMAKAEEQRHEAAIAAIKADYKQAVAAEEGNHKISLTLTEVAELKAQADAEAEKAGLAVSSAIEDAKAESEELKKKPVAVVPPTPPAPVALQAPTALELAEGLASPTTK